MSEVLYGLDKIAQYCCTNKNKVSSLIEDDVIPAIIKYGGVKRYSTYSYVIDFVKERILNHPSFLFNRDVSDNDLTNQVFTKYPLMREDVWKTKKEDAIVQSFVNLKGGVGKSTASITTASALSILGAKVLIIELDPQSNIAEYLGQPVSKNNFSDVVLEYLRTDKIIELNNCITNFKFSNSNFDGLVSDYRMLGKIELIKDNSFLKNIAYRLRDKYDFIIIDTPPSMQSSLMLSYVASDFLNLVTIPESLSVSGVQNLLSGVSELNSENIKNGNAENVCNIKNAIVTKIDGRMLNDQMMNLKKLEATLEHFGVSKDNVYKVKNSIVFPESTSSDNHCPVFDLSKQYPKSIEDGSPYFKMALNLYSERVR